MSNLENIFRAWEQRWELTHPYPKQRYENGVTVLLYIVIFGSIFLSGSRTGNVMAEIASLANLAERADYLGLNRGVFIAIEALLGFLTFEAGIILAGYLMVESNDTIKKEYWYIVLLVSAFIPALFSNLYPGWQLIEQHIPNASGVGQIVVDSIVGLLTPVMSFLSGASLSVIRKEQFKQSIESERAYEEKKRKAWERSNDYRALLKQPEEKTGDSSILQYIPKEGVTVPELAKHLGISQSRVYSEIAKVDGRVKRVGETLFLT